MPRCYRLRMACQPSSDRAYAGWRHSLFNFIISALKKRGGSIFRICQGSHLGSGFWGWGFQYSATVYFVPSGIRRIGSDNFHCVLGILVGFKKLMDIILFGIKIENRWNGNNTPIEYSPVFFFQWKIFVRLRLISGCVRLGRECQSYCDDEQRYRTSEILLGGPRILGGTTECGLDRGRCSQWWHIWQ